MIKKGVFYLFLGIVVILLGITSFVLAVNFEFFGHIYSRKELKEFKNQTATRIYSRDEVLIGKFFVKNRTNINFAEIPTHVIDALVATEDARYFEHEGVDSRSLIRVLFKTIILNDASSGGGSTITQQLLKNMYGRKKFGPLTMLVNKTKEGILAHRLESIYSKEEILALYLNTVPFGENVYGIETASRLFYNKPAVKLQIDEGAVLIGMLKANTYYNPRLYPDHALTRRNTVLLQMNKYGYINSTVLDSLKRLPLTLDYANLESEGPANYFLVEVKKELEKILLHVENTTGKKWDYTTDGLRVKTSLDYQLQIMALNSFRKHLSVMQKKLRQQYKSGNSLKSLNALIQKELKRKKLLDSAQKVHKQEIFTWDSSYVDSITTTDSIKLALTTLQSGFVAMNPKNGDILTWVGGIDFRTQPYDQINANRQMASTFKPILYAAALEKGMKPCDYLSNNPKTYVDFGNWSPSNYDNTEGGSYSLTGALMHSKNIPTVDLLFQVGFDDVDYLWRKLGFSYDLENTPSLALGTSDASLLEVATAYSVFANVGFKVSPSTILSIKTAGGELIYEKPKTTEMSRIVEERTGLFLNEILQKAINQGTGASIRSTYNVNIALAGKTGTSQNFADAWFVGYNPDLVLATRVGTSNPSVHFNNGANGSGGRLALPLVALTLRQLENKKELLKFYDSAFLPLSDSLLESMNCPDFMEDSALDKILELFSKDETTIEEEQKKRINTPAKKPSKRNKLKDLFKRRK